MILLTDPISDSLHQERAFPGAPLGAQTTAEILDDPVVEPLATSGPATRPGQLLDAVSQTGEADEAWRLAELFAQFRAEQREEGQFEALDRKSVV